MDDLNPAGSQLPFTLLGSLERAINPSFPPKIGQYCDESQALKIAIDLAWQGFGPQSPNPCVGAVILDQRSEIVSWGVTETYGGRHAERVAIDQLPSHIDPRQCTLVATLEPCNHYGKQPPCAEMIAQRQFKKIVFGATDPNPQVSGQGADYLRSRGMVSVHKNDPESLAWHADFFHAVKFRRPLWIAKWAQNEQGVMAADDGKPRWITGRQIQNVTHALRRRTGMTVVGANTLLQDRSRLDVRFPDQVLNTTPLRGVIDLRGRFRTQLPVFSAPIREAPWIVMSADVEIPQLLKSNYGTAFESGAIRWWGGLQGLSDVAQKISDLGLLSVFFEGGATLHRAWQAEVGFDHFFQWIGKTPLLAPQKKYLAINPIELRAQRISSHKIGDDTLHDWKASV